MEWACVLRSSGPAEAWLVRDWLAQNGIPVVVRDDLSAARGEIGIAESWPTVWVPRSDVERATAALAVYRSPRLVHPRWVCGCGEVNEPTFGSCWACGADGPSVAEADRDR